MTFFCLFVNKKKKKERKQDLGSHFVGRKILFSETKNVINYFGIIFCKIVVFLLNKRLKTKNSKHYFLSRVIVWFQKLVRIYQENFFKHHPNKKISFLTGLTF